MTQLRRLRQTSRTSSRSLRRCSHLLLLRPRGPAFAAERRLHRPRSYPLKTDKERSSSAMEKMRCNTDLQPCPLVRDFVREVGEEISASLRRDMVQLRLLQSGPGARFREGGLFVPVGDFVQSRRTLLGLGAGLWRAALVGFGEGNGS